MKKNVGPPTILVADDEPTNLDVLLADSATYCVLSAATGGG